MGLLTRNWWALAIRGVAAILFGIVAILMPGMTLWALVLLFAAYMLVDGIFAIIAGMRAAEHHERWWPLVLEGVLDLAAGIVAVAWPLLTLLVFIYIAAFWAIVTGSALLVAGFRLHHVHGEWLLLLGGLLSLLWGILVAFWPILGLIAWAWWMGFYALLFGGTMIALAFRLRRLGGMRGGG